MEDFERSHGSSDLSKNPCIEGYKPNNANLSPLSDIFQFGHFEMLWIFKILEIQIKGDNTKRKNKASNIKTKLEV